jgi:hypothetical protein
LLQLMYPVGSIWHPVAGRGQAQLKGHPHWVEIGTFGKLCESGTLPDAVIRPVSPHPP